MSNGNKNTTFVEPNVLSISAKFQLHPTYGFLGDDLWIFYRKFSFLLPWQPINSAVWTKFIWLLFWIKKTTYVTLQWTFNRKCALSLASNANTQTWPNEWYNAYKDIVNMKPTMKTKYWKWQRQWCFTTVDVVKRNRYWYDNRVTTVW